VRHASRPELCYLSVRVVDRKWPMMLQTKALRMRMYVLCSECAHLIDLARGDRPQRVVESRDAIRHESEGHGFWLEMLGINE